MQPASARKEANESRLGTREGFENCDIPFSLRQHDDGVPLDEVQCLQIHIRGLEERIGRFPKVGERVHNHDFKPERFPLAHERVLDVVTTALCNQDEPFCRQHRFDEHLEDPATIRFDINLIFVRDPKGTRDRLGRVDEVDPQESRLALLHRAKCDLADRPFRTSASQGPSDHVTPARDEDLEAGFREGRPLGLRDGRDRELLSV